jgi:hypothetical protein
MMGAIHIYGRDWGDLDKLDGLDWLAVAAQFFSAFSMAFIRKSHIQLTPALTILVTDSGVCCPVIL